MRLVNGLALALVVVALAGCAPRASSLEEMGCRTINEYLPELDAFQAGEVPGDDAADLWERVKEEIRLGYFDDETGSLFALLTDAVADSQNDSFTPVDVDYSDMRDRAVRYCVADIGWDMSNR